ncbi:MAG: hypothetical protein ABSA46_22360, partial [Thermodesulfovibrionales bacterium]
MWLSYSAFDWAASCAGALSSTLLVTVSTAYPATVPNTDPTTMLVKPTQVIPRMIPAAVTTLSNAVACSGPNRWLINTS